jgi:selenium metabolism protein YedF
VTKKVFLIQSEGLGRDDDKLGSVLMSTFLRVMGEGKDKPETIVFWNTGVKLVCEGSQVLVVLKQLEEQGVTILACGTCLDYFQLKDKIVVGKPTTMVKSIQSMLGSEMVTL